MKLKDYIKTRPDAAFKARIFINEKQIAYASLERQKTGIMAVKLHPDISELADVEVLECGKPDEHGYVDIQVKPNQIILEPTIKSNQIILEAGKSYILPIKEGYLDLIVSADPEYPGIDIEYVSDKKSKPENGIYTRPRMLIENNENVLRAVVWGDPHREDYTAAINFTCVEDIKK